MVELGHVDVVLRWMVTVMQVALGESGQSFSNPRIVAYVRKVRPTCKGVAGECDMASEFLQTCSHMRALV